MTQDRRVWGISTLIDLADCNPDTIRDPKQIKEFVLDLCTLLQVKRYGECKIIHFGEDKRVAGYSMIQLIETSLVSGHFVNETNNAFIDIFSCKVYESGKAAVFAKDFFEARLLAFDVTDRFNLTK